MRCPADGEVRNSSIEVCRRSQWLNNSFSACLCVDSTSCLMLDADVRRGKLKSGRLMLDQSAKHGQQQIFITFPNALSAHFVANMCNQNTQVMGVQTCQQSSRTGPPCSSDRPVIQCKLVVFETIYTVTPPSKSSDSTSVSSRRPFKPR